MRIGGDRSGSEAGRSPVPRIRPGPAAARLLFPVCGLLVGLVVLAVAHGVYGLGLLRAAAIAAFAGGALFLVCEAV